MIRADPHLYTEVSASIQQSEQALQTAVSQLSSGKRVSAPSDDALAFAQSVQNAASSAMVDTYSKNIASVTTQAQVADAALSSVVTSLTKAVTLGTEGGNGSISSSQRSSLAQQVQVLLTQVVSQANTTSNGTALFGGTAGVTTAFTADAASTSGYAYQGNSSTNQAQVSQSLAVTVNIPGDEIFTNSSGNVLGSMQGLITALNSGTTDDIAKAVVSINASITHVGQVRAVLGGTVNQLTTESDYISQETVSLATQQQALVDIDTATAATNLTQAQTAQSAVLAMAAKILPTSLLNYLQG